MTNARELRITEANHDFNNDPPNAIHQLIIATGRWLELVTGEPEAVSKAMNALLSSMGANWGIDETPSGNWSENWTDVGWEVGHENNRAFQIELLMAFGKHGVLLDVQGSEIKLASTDGRIEFVDTLIQDMRAFYDAIPVGWKEQMPRLAQELDVLERVLLAAEGRFRVDTDKPVSADQLAAMTGLGLRSMKNLLLPSSPSGLRTDEQGLVPAKLARPWLESRPDYKASMWLDPDTSTDGTTEAEKESADDDLEGEVFFVPVAADGTHFDPATCRRSGTYQIGIKGAERNIENFREALGELSRMKKPAWRRPNQNGNWGIVQGQSWTRMSAAELGLVD